MRPWRLETAIIRGMRRLSVCILGGSGFIGQALCARLVRLGHGVRVVSRAPLLPPGLAVLPGLELWTGNAYNRAFLRSAVAGQDVVINLVGILNEAGRDGRGFERAHVDLTRAVVAACREAHVPRLLHMSALHASDQGPSHYLRTKAAAERVVHDGCGEVGWTIFQPSVVFGPQDSFINRFASLLRLLPFLPLARANARFAPVHVEDVVSAFVLAMNDPKTIRETYQLCGPEVFTLRELVCYVRDQRGLRRWIFGIPDWAGRLQAGIMDFVPGKPLSTDNFLSLTVDSVGTHDGFARLDLDKSSLRTVVPSYLGPEQRAGRLARLRASR